MKIAATKKMATTISEAARAAGMPYAIELVKIPHDVYSWVVGGDPWDACDWGDYDSSGRLKVIKVTYPAEYYAMPGYLTTKELNRLYMAGDTITTYAARVLEAIEI